MIQRNVATIKAPRNKFSLSYNLKTSASIGTLYPVYIQEIYPGDTFKCNTTFVARLTSSYLRPVMDNLFVDFYYFFVPSRLCYDKWEQIFGENRQSAWAQPEPVKAPVNSVTDYPQEIKSGSVGDYLGLPLGQLPYGTNMLPFRAFARIYDEWFRDENLIDPMYIRTGEWDASNEIPNDNPWTPSNYTGKPPKVSKFHDVFTSALPNTQKSLSPVNVPLSGFVPMTVNENPQYLHSLGGKLVLATNDLGQSVNFMGAPEAGTGRKYLTGVPALIETLEESDYVNSTNAGIDLSKVGVLSVPDLRYAFQLQRILERSARSGTRYTEFLLSAFGVQSPDARLQRSEYLGGKRVPLSVQQVAQTTRGDNDFDELGTLGAFSLSNGRCGYSKGFVEHGFVIGVMCIRQHHTYQQGIEKFWQRSDRFSYYDPALAHISEQPIYKTELYGASSRNICDDIFGYQEAWYDLRNRQNVVTGQMRSGATNSKGENISLDIWHYADLYAHEPFLNKTYIEETPDYVDRTIAVPSESLDQFIFDIEHTQTAIRRLPKYSTPGLIDHY